MKTMASKKLTAEQLVKISGGWRRSMATQDSPKQGMVFPNGLMGDPG